MPDELNFGLGEKLIIGFVFYISIFRFFPIYLAGSIFLATLVAFIFSLKKRVQTIENLGLPGPKPNLFTGNLLDYSRDGLFGCDMKWRKEYGKVYGAYLWTMPEIIIGDLDILKQILVKDFANFTDRRKIGLSSKSKSMFAHILTVLDGQRWRDVRRTVTPAFTAGKMKQMVPLINECVATLDEILGEKAKLGEGFDCKEVFGNFTMDVIALAAFGMKANAQRDQDNPLVQHGSKIFRISLTNPRFIIAFLFPWTLHQLNQWFGFRLLFGEVEDFFVDYVSQMIQERRKIPQGAKKDFLDLLIRAQESDEKMEDDLEISHSGLGGKKVTLSMTDMIAQSFLFLFAGYDTTATALHFLLYCLATNQDKQRKCVEEINAVVGDASKVTYEHIHQMPYLEAVMMEALRLYPPAVRFDRVAIQDYEVNGVHIPAGTTINAPVYAIHHSEEYYDEPESFMPERFLGDWKSSRDPLAFLPFGYGPRNCIGMRFAQMEIKLALAKILPKYCFGPTMETELPPLKLATNSGILRPENPIWLRVEERKD